VAFVRRRLSIILSACSITLGIGLLYLVTATPTFTANAELFVASKSGTGDAASVSTIVESQVAIIRSEGIARDVIRKLDLAEDPEFARRNVLHRIVRSMSRRLGWSGPETDSSMMSDAVETFDRKLSVKRAGVTYIVDMTFESLTPERAAQILNTVAETYIADQMDAKYKFTLPDEIWIKDRLTELNNRASAAQVALEDYHKNKNDIRGFADVDQERTLDDAARSSKAAYDNFQHALRQTEAVQQQSAPVFEASLVTRASPPLRASSPKAGILLGISAIGGLLLGVSIGLLRDASDRGIRASKEVSNEVQRLCIAVVPRVKSRGAKLGVGLGDSGARLAAAVFAVALLFAAATDYIPILSDQDGTVFGLFKPDVYKETLYVASGVGAAIAAVISRRAALLFLRVLGIFYFLDGALGIFTGSSYLALGIFTQGVVSNSPVQLSSTVFHLGIGLFGMFAGWYGGQGKLVSQPDLAPRTIVGSDSPIWTPNEAPQSRFTRAFLEIKLAIESTNRKGKRNQVIGITSTYQNEGKSTVAAALALVLAQSGARAILVDLNSRNGSLSAELAPAAGNGVLDVMSGAAPLCETTWIEPVTQLAFLPLGKNRPIRPSELLSGGSVDRLLQILRASHEYVIVDLPAVAPFAEAQAAIGALDSLIFVIEANRTNVDAVKRGRNVIGDENIVGVVLNKANATSA
jgi:capsular exopolysaccharide synthesis family protein